MLARRTEAVLRAGLLADMCDRADDEEVGAAKLGRADCVVGAAGEPVPCTLVDRARAGAMAARLTPVEEEETDRVEAAGAVWEEIAPFVVCPTASELRDLRKAELTTGFAGLVVLTAAITGRGATTGKLVPHIDSNTLSFSPAMLRSCEASNAKVEESSSAFALSPTSPLFVALYSSSPATSRKAMVLLVATATSCVASAVERRNTSSSASNLTLAFSASTSASIALPKVCIVSEDSVSNF